MMQVMSYLVMLDVAASQLLWAGEGYLAQPKTKILRGRSRHHSHFIDLLRNKCIHSMQIMHLTNLGYNLECPV